jgi:hypothetical protein
LKRRARLLVGRGEESGGVPAEEPLRQQTRVERRLGLGDSRLPQLLPAGGDAIVNGCQETAVASFSFSD